MNIAMIKFTNSYNKLVFLLFPLSIFCFYLLNVFTNIAIDDFVYKHIITNVAEEEGVRVLNFKDVLESQYNHYFITNGRVLLNGLAQLFLIPDSKIYFNIANSVFFGVFQLLLLEQFGKGFLKYTAHHFLILILSLWFLIPGPNHTFLWLNGSINYLWGIVLVLLFLRLFKKVHFENKFHKIIYIPILFLFAFISGFTHEVFTVGLSGALFINFVINYKKYSVYSTTLILGIFLGTFFMVIAPGNLVRLSGSNMDNLSGFIMVMKKIGRLIASLPNLLAFSLLICSLVVLYFKDKAKLKLIYLNNSILIHSILISLLFIVLSGALDARVYFGIAVFSIMIIFSIIKECSISFTSFRMKVLIGIMTAVMLVEFYCVLNDLKYNKTIFDADEITWRNSNENVFPKYEKRSNRFVCEGLGGSDRFFWSNKAMSWYYNKDYMIFIPTSLHDLIYGSSELRYSKKFIYSHVGKNNGDSLNIYHSAKIPYLIFQTTANNVYNLKAGAHVTYHCDEMINVINKESFIVKLKNKLYSTNEIYIQSEKSDCFVLPTANNGFYLFAAKPKYIPINKINMLTIVVDPKEKKAHFLYNFNGI
jgi:hypothetical protein